MDLQQNTIIESIGVYLPPESVSTGDVLTGCKNEIQFPLEKISGIKNRRMAGQTEFSIDLARNAITECLAKSKYDPADIDLLICCNISRYDGAGLVSFEPCTSSKLRQELGFTNAMVFDISNACAGMFTGIYVANAFINTGVIRRAMVVSGEYITHIARTAQKEIESFMDNRLACLTLGDAGAAVILERSADKKNGFQKFDLQTFGGYSQYCIAKPNDYGGWLMYTDSVKLTDVAVRSGSKHAVHVMQSAGWSAEEFQHLIMHQTSSMTMNSAKREINKLLNKKICHDGNTINNLAQRGNTASNSHFVALADRIYNNEINSGDKIVFSISASGLTTGTALYVFDDLPDRLREMGSTASVQQKKSPFKELNGTAMPIAPRIRIECVGTIPPETVIKKNSIDLLCQAATTCLHKSEYDPGDIGLLIYCGVYRSEYIMEPAFAALLAGELNMNSQITDQDNNKTVAFDMFNGSVGFLNACYTAQQLMAGEECKTAMIVTAEIENNAGLFPDKLLGIRETGSALILDTKQPGNKGFSRFQFSCHGKYQNAYSTCYNAANAIPYLQIEKNTELEDIYLECILPTVCQLLQTEGYKLDRIDTIFPPQISTDFITRLADKLNCPREKFIDVVGDGHDLFTSSIPCAVDYAWKNDIVRSGDTGLMIAVGSGLQVGCAIYHF